MKRLFALLAVGSLGLSPAAAQAPTILDLLENERTLAEMAPPAPVREPALSPLSVPLREKEAELETRAMRRYGRADRVQSRIDWAGAKAVKTRFASDGRAGSANVPRPELDKAMVPVLMPERVRRNATFFATEDFYHGVIPGDGYHLSYHGTRLVSRTKGGGATTNLDIYELEDGMAASFSLFGAAYSVILSCDDVQADQRCRSENFMRQRIKDLAVYISTAGEAQ